MSPDRVLEGSASMADPGMRTADDVPKRPPRRTLPRRPLGRYVVALTIIGLLVVASTLIMSTALNRQEKDAGVIATAANQIHLSRQITESARELEVGKGAESAGDLKEALNQLTRAHVDLLFGDEFEGIPGDL